MIFHSLLLKYILQMSHFPASKTIFFFNKITMPSILRGRQRIGQPASTGISTMKWPSQSPDLNPMEHFWCLVKRRLGEYQESPDSIHELMKRVDVVWKNIHENSCQTLIESMPSRVVAVIRARGGHTRYQNHASKNSTWSPDSNPPVSSTFRHSFCEKFRVLLEE